MIRNAQNQCTIRAVSMQDCLADWKRLAGVLTDRHAISGISNFSLDALRAMAQTPGLFASTAELDDEIVSINLWLPHENVLYAHLSASSERGYAVPASYGLVGWAIDKYRSHTIDLGGCAGLSDDPTDGLWIYKERFANASATALLCGAILDSEAYGSTQEESSYFPAYRSGG
jgi:hypothetical protein